MQPYLELLSANPQVPLIALVMLVVFVASAVGIRRKRALLRRIAYILPGRVEGWLPPRFVGELEGLPFKVTPLPGGKNSPPSLQVEVLTAPSFELTVTRQGALNSLGARLGLLKDLETPDPDFNRHFLLSGDGSGLAAQFLAEERRRLEIRELFGAGYVRLVIGPKGVSALKSPANDYDDLDPATAADRVKRLAALAKAARMY